MGETVNPNHPQGGTYNKNDPVYLRTPQYREAKESFKVIYDIIREHFSKHGKDKPISLIDIGGASGSFLFFAKKALSLSEAVTTDISDLHLKQAKENIPDASVHLHDILKEGNNLGRRFDVVTCNGTMAIFDDIEIALKNLMTFVDSHGCLVVLDIVNDHPIDVHLQYRKLHGENPKQWNVAFNVRSKETYERILESIDSTLRFEWTDFRMPFPIPKTSDPLRAWTMKTEHNENQIVVGTGQLLNFKILKAYR